MPYITVGEENNAPIEIYYEDHGTGTPVVLSHGYPLTGQAWEKQVSALLDAGYRTITYDRRGWGDSSRPGIGYDYDTFAADLQGLMEKLDLRDAVLVGHSMGTGDVTHYLGRYGSDRVSKAVLVSAIPPYLLKTPDNPEGLPQAMFDGFLTAAKADRLAWLKSFLDNFYNMDMYRGSLVSEAAYEASFSIAAAGSAIAAAACIPAWLTDFRADVAALDVPVMVVHGDQDRVLPIGNTGSRLPALIEGLRYVVIEGGPHAIAWTHADQVNAALLEFLK